MKSSIGQVGLFATSLGRAILLTTLVGSGLWRAAATCGDAFIRDLARELQAGPLAPRVWPGYGHALRGVAWFRSTAGRAMRRGEPVAGRHKRIATNLDNSLLGWLSRLEG